MKRTTFRKKELSFRLRPLSYVMSDQGMQHPLNRLGATADPLRQRFEATLLGTFPSCAIFPVSIYGVKMQLSVSFL